MQNAPTSPAEHQKIKWLEACTYDGFEGSLEEFCEGASPPKILCGYCGKDCEGKCGGENDPKNAFILSPSGNDCMVERCEKNHCMKCGVHTKNDFECRDCLETKKESAHTKGPWEVVHTDDMENCVELRGDSGSKPLAYIFTMSEAALSEYETLESAVQDMAEHKANGRLMTAAPRLLKALKGMVDEIGMAELFEHDMEDCGPETCTFCEARAAIEMAGG